MTTAWSPASKADYDFEKLGIPKFVNTNYIDLAKISQIAKYRSHVGHNYSDYTQFGNDGLKVVGSPIENCVSMKHYFLTPDSSVNLYSPVAGTVNFKLEGALGGTIEITSDAQPDFHFSIFHIELSTPLAVGDHVSEGQRLGTHTGTETWSDMAVWVQTPHGKHLISYFDTLTDAAFAPFQARGVASRADLSDPKQTSLTPSCSFSNLPEDIVNLTGPMAVQQSVAVATTLPDIMNVGDAPTEVKATATSGLPAVLVSATPKVCAATDNKVTPRRPGLCKLLVTQPGDAATFAATPIAMRTRILPQGIAALTQPRLGIVYPPNGSGPQSYVRFFNTGTAAGTVTVSLIDGSTGKPVSKWQSPSIAPGAAPQYGIDDLESNAGAGFTRPSTYSLKVEPETSITGYMQHVIFDQGIEALTNASTCDTGVMTDPYRLVFVHSSLMDSAYPSTIVLNNVGGNLAGLALTLRDAADGSTVGRLVPSTAEQTTYPNNQLIVRESQTESSAQVVPNSPARVKLAPTAYHFNMVADDDLYLPADSRIYKHYYQHLVTNVRSGVVSDMTTMCALNGKSPSTANLTLRNGAVFSSLQASTQSYLRFYNSGVTAGAVTVKLYGNNDDQPLGSWVSPSIPAGSMQEYPISKIESELTLYQKDSYKPQALVKENFYGMAITTDIDGYFQNVVLHTPDGTYSNLSTCSEAVTTTGPTLMGVYSSLKDATYRSAVIIHNTGPVATPVWLSIYAATDGAPLAGYATPTIPANGLLALNIADIEAAAHLAPRPAWDRYIIKAEGSFAGFLQHLVKNEASGIVTDMTTACMM